MKAVAKNTRRWPVLKVKTAVKAGYYLGLTLSAGGGTGVSDLNTPNTSTTNTSTTNTSTPG